MSDPDNQPQYWWGHISRYHLYFNPTLIDAQVHALVAAAQGEVADHPPRSFEEQMNFAARFGAAWAWLDFKKGSVEELNDSSKVNALICYHLQQGSLPGFDVQNGNQVRFARDFEAHMRGPVENRAPGLGVVNGLFTISPPEPHLGLEDLTGRLNDPRVTTWVAHSAPGANIVTTMPFLSTGFTSTSAMACRRLPSTSDEQIRIEALALCQWKGKELWCEPLAWTVIR